MSDTADTAASNRQMSDTVGATVPDRPRKVKSKKGRRILAVILIFLLLLMCVLGYLLYRVIAPPKSNSTTINGLTWVRSIYGINNTAEGALERAQAAVPAADGTIWVIDGAHRSLFHFTPDGRFTGQLKGPADTPFVTPGRFSIGPDGKFYVCETSLDSIRVIDGRNREAGSFNIPKPVSVAVGEDRIVVGSVAGFAILDKTGRPIKVVGSRGQGPEQFDYVHGVAFGDNGNIYVVDSFNNRLSAYDADGKRLWIQRTGNQTNAAKGNGTTIGLDPPLAEDSVLATDQALQLPLGMTVDGAGRIVVIDMFDCTLNVFNPDTGAFIGKYGEAGAEDGQFFYPQSVSYDKGRDWFIVADSLNNRVEIVRLPGSAGSGGAQAALRRGLAGPLRACLLPFLLILLALIVWLVARAVRKRRAEAQPVTVAPVEAAQETPVVTVSEPLGGDFAENSDDKP